MHNDVKGDAMMYIGLSLSRCVKDILDGREDIENVSHLVTGTCVHTPAAWDGLIQKYSELHWRGHSSTDILNTLEALFRKGIIQPRMWGEEPTRYGNDGHWIPAADVPPHLALDAIRAEETRNSFCDKRRTGCRECARKMQCPVLNPDDERSIPEEVMKIKALAEAALRGIEIGTPLYHGGLTIFPLRFRQSAVVDHIALEDALKSGAVEITEISEGGSVPELLLINKGERNVLLIDGEELVGAKQNRILNISILAGGGTKLRIPVSCVEAGRWQYRSTSFELGMFATTDMRSRGKAEVMRSSRISHSFHSDQCRVWRDVDDALSDLGTFSDTSSLHDGLLTLDDEMRGYVENLKLPTDANGFIAAIGSRVLGGDVFAGRDVMQKSWPRLLRGAVIEAIKLRDKPPATEPGVAEAFMDKVAAAVAEPYTPPGLGVAVHIDGEDVLGNVLIVDEAVVHISMFKRVS